MANRILAREGVVDALGHASVRHPLQPERFIISYSRSPGLVTQADLGEFDLHGTDVAQSGRKPYLERFIHAAIYEARPDVGAVVHNHAQEVIPFTVTSVSLRPVMHVAGFLGERVPVWDIRDRFQDTDLLVRNMEQARDLARTLGKHTAALMRGHGCIVVGPDIRAAVASAIYMRINAGAQLHAMQLGEPRYLTAREARLASETNLGKLALARMWEYWQGRVLDGAPFHTKADRIGP
jgi:HCOMODA/2-hydroxy-3-carboxy-muconic semialdehyde decarboxylase